MNMRRVVVTDYTFPDLDRERKAAIAAGCEFEAHQCRSADEIAEALRGATVGVVQFGTVNQAAIDGLGENAALIRYGIGFDNIDVAAASARNVPVGYVPDYCPNEVADHTCAAMLTLLRKLSPLDASVRRGDWTAVAVATPLKAFSDTLIGFFGFGQIGRGVHARLKVFGFQFAVADPALSSEDAAALGLQKMSPEELFQKADAVSLHAPATRETTHFVNAERLSTMQPHAVIVNSARGALIEEAALAAALNSGQIAGAALDVFEEEPLSASSVLRDAPGALLTPHAAWYSDSAIGRLQQLVADDIANHLAGRRLRKAVPGSVA
mgnify:CR=1 FL=1